MLLIVVVALLVWQGVDARPAAVAALPAKLTDTGSISVSGSSAIRVQPDRVVVLFGVGTFAATPAGSHTLNAAQSRAVIAAIRAQNIAERDIATADFSLHPRYDDFNRNIRGYWARNSIAVTLRDVQKLEPVLVAAMEAGATSVDGIDFSVTNLRQLRDQAREQAIQAALEKARDMASAAGMTLGSVTNISEGSVDSWSGSQRQWTNHQNVMQDLSAEGAITLEDGSISLGQIVVQAQVSLSAELAKK